MPPRFVSRRSGTCNIPVDSDRRPRASADARTNRPRRAGSRRRASLGREQLSNPGAAEYLYNSSNSECITSVGFRSGRDYRAKIDRNRRHQPGAAQHQGLTLTSQRRAKQNRVRRSRPDKMATRGRGGLRPAGATNCVSQPIPASAAKPRPRTTSAVITAAGIPSIANTFEALQTGRSCASCG